MPRGVYREGERGEVEGAERGREIKKNRERYIGGGARGPIETLEREGWREE